jgi:hypothetical protein
LGQDGPGSGLGCTTLGALAEVDTIAAIASQLPRDGAGRAHKGSGNLSHGEVLNMEAGESHAFIGLDLFVAIERSDLHLRTLQGWLVVHLTYVFAINTNSFDTFLLIFKNYLLYIFKFTKIYKIVNNIKKV